MLPIKVFTLMEKNPEIKQTLEVEVRVIEKPPYSLEEIELRRKSAEERAALADSVCEKYKKGDDFNFSLEKRGDTYSIILDGVQVGALTIRDNGDTKQIAFIMINKNLQNKGFGKQLYIKFNDYFKQTDGSIIMMDSMRVSEPATYLWLSLVKDGLAEEVAEETTPDGHKLYRFKRD